MTIEELQVLRDRCAEELGRWGLSSHASGVADQVLVRIPTLLALIDIAEGAARRVHALDVWRKAFYLGDAPQMEVEASRLDEIDYKLRVALVRLGD